MTSEQLNEEILKIPFWRRWLICLVLCRKEWKVAEAYNKVAIDALNNGDDELYEKVKNASVSKWSILYFNDFNRYER